VPLQLLCRKLGTTQIFSEGGECIPVTVLEAEPNVVVQKKTPETDGYSALQLGFGERRPARTPRPLRGHFEKAGVAPRRHLVESRLTAEEAEPFEVGAEIKVDIFEQGQRVDVVGTSKGRGTAGVVKRHGFAIKRRTHGTHEFFRHGGSIGAGADPSRVLKGLGMAGRMGAERVTALNLEVVRVDPEQGLLFVKGSVPGHAQGLVRVRPSVKRRR
jgi:large subunit ribosomal protein L3